MDQHLLAITYLRRLTWAELKPVLPKMDGKLMLLGKKGSRKYIPHCNVATPEQWQQACDQGLVYLDWRHEWAFAPHLDDTTGLPLLMVPYAEAFKRLQAPAEAGAPQPPAQQELQLQPAATATTPTT